MKRISVPRSLINQSILYILLNEGMVSRISMGIEYSMSVDLKYRNGKRALQSFSLISKPSRRIFATAEECRAMCLMNVGLVKHQVLGQITILNTVYGILELKDCIGKKVGGEVLCYAT